MSLLAEFEAVSPDLALGPTLEAMPSLDIEIERQYALEPDRPIIFCWIRAPDVDRLEHALARDRTIAAFDRLERAGGRLLYRMQRSRSDGIESYRRWVSLGGELLRCLGANGRWEFEMRFPDRDSFTEYHEFLEAHGVEFDLYRLSNGDRPRESDTVLTPSQREALTLAHEYGFFAVPRETTLTDIAGTLDISDQAVSERLRRGLTRLLDEHVI